MYGYIVPSSSVNVVTSRIGDGEVQTELEVVEGSHSRILGTKLKLSEQEYIKKELTSFLRQAAYAREANKAAGRHVQGVDAQAANQDARDEHKNVDLEPKLRSRL